MMATAWSQAWPPLAPEQQKLLYAALASNHAPHHRKPDVNGIHAPTGTPNGPAAAAAAATTNAPASAPMNSGVNPAVLSSASPDTFGTGSVSPNPFERRDSEPASDDPFPNFPTDEMENEQREKRKTPDVDDEDDLDGGLDRPEGKEAKKPGRKLLTSEPTTKRKAQNRAAQRAFRERKEKHLKELETKVADLEKASESANHENSVLRAQVERLQDQVRDYRRRVSVNCNSPGAAAGHYDPARSLATPGVELDFNFDFHKFGSGQHGTMVPSTQGMTAFAPHPPAAVASPGRFNPHHHGSMSSASTIHSAQITPNETQGSTGQAMFQPGFFDVMGPPHSTQSPQPLSSNGPSPSVHGRPSPAHSTSSSAQSPGSITGRGPSSSCCTSPGSTDWSNVYKANEKPAYNAVDRQTTVTPGLTNDRTPSSENLSLDFLSHQNGGSFDPVLFDNHYRDSQDAIVGEGSFSGGLFEESMQSFPDFNDPFSFNMSSENLAQQPGSKSSDEQRQKGSNLLEQVDQAANGEYSHEPPSNDQFVRKTEYYTPNLMTCHKIWNQLQTIPKFKTGDFDVDSLCTELSNKARCTETGITVPKPAVELALWKLAGNPLNHPEPTTLDDKYASGPIDAKSDASSRFQKFMAAA